MKVFRRFLEELQNMIITSNLLDTKVGKGDFFGYFKLLFYNIKIFLPIQLGVELDGEELETLHPEFHLLAGVLDSSVSHRHGWGSTIK